MAIEAAKRIEGSADAWLSLLEGVPSSAKKLASWLRSLIDAISSSEAARLVLYEANPSKLIVPLDAEKPRLSMGVDSSVAGPFKIASRSLVLASTGLVVLEGDRLVDKRSHISLEVGLEDSDHRLAMFREELRALEWVLENAWSREGSPLVFLDGPIVDPPYIAGGEVGAYRDYFEERARLVSEILGRGGIVVGVVKRIESRILATKLESMGLRLPSGVDDKLLASIVFHAWLAPLLDYVAGPSEDMIPATRPIELGGEPYSFFLERGVRVYSIYAILGLRKTRRLVRIDVATPRTATSAREAVWRSIVYAYALTPPGQGIPLPVILAHELCTIRSREARKIFARMLSAFVASGREAGRIEPIIYDILGSEGG
ncbi:MAG: DNA double-strand break repair nuclease NurA [Pyrodictiaceae archaeon]